MTRAGPSLEQRFADAMGGLLGPDFPSDIGLAVSGGGDSMAMLTLAHNWTRVWGVRLWVVTIDHGLRDESADEAAMVAHECAALGWPHAILRWHWDGAGNLQDAARHARLDLIGRWRGSLRHVLMAHTRDDMAETFLMRLKRGSGVDGLSAMQDRRGIHTSGPVAPLPGADWSGEKPPSAETQGDTAPFEILRPCLTMGRAELRHYLTVLKGRWADDPSNDDPKYERVRMRRLLEDLEKVGLGAALLSETASRLRRAQEALQQRALQVWFEIGGEGRTEFAPTGDLLLARSGFDRVERETQLRLLAAALQYVSSAPYRPRAEPLESLLDRLLGGGGGTLHGCECRAEKDHLRVFREEKPLKPLTIQARQGGFWDQRWRICGPITLGLQIRNLGDDGWRFVENKRDTAIPYHAARSLPSVWKGDVLQGCDALGIGRGDCFALWPFAREGYGFTQFLLSH